MKIALFVAVAIALLVVSAGAQTYSSQASATIQATATVVPAMGGSYEEEPVQVASLGDVGLSGVTTTPGVLSRDGARGPFVLHNPR